MADLKVMKILFWGIVVKGVNIDGTIDHVLLQAMHQVKGEVKVRNHFGPRDDRDSCFLTDGWFNKLVST